jgi:transposase
MLRVQIRRRHDATLSELRSHLADQAQVEVSIPTLGRVLQQLGLGRKKSAWPPVSAITISVPGSGDGFDL